MPEPFSRIKRLPPYVFAIVNTMKLEARRRGEDIIDLGMGNPDQGTPQHIVDKLIEAVQNPKNHRYSASKGITKLRAAICDRYRNKYGVDLDPESEAGVTIGSKEGLSHLALATVEPGDVVLTTTPAYPIHPYSVIIAGGEVRLRLGPGDRLVEIGPGWGYMGMLAAEKYGADVTAYGLVADQNDGMRRLMSARGFRGKISLVEKDHRELADEPSRYDRFVSIGVHEHAGRDCNEQWIRSIALGLRPGGIGFISATFNISKRPTNYCTIKYIFPGGYIPGLAETLLLMEKYGLDVRMVENRSYHYHRTVNQWLKNFEANWERIRAIDPARFDEKFRRAWLFYLGGAAETFEAAREVINCYHITFVKGHFVRRGRSRAFGSLR